MDGSLPVIRYRLFTPQKVQGINPGSKSYFAVSVQVFVVRGRLNHGSVCFELFQVATRIQN